MRLAKSRALFGVAFLVASIGIVALVLRGIRVEDYRDTKAAGGEFRRPLDFLAVHSSPPQYLTVNGHTYRGIRGSAPYYLDVPALNSILFVTGLIGGPTVFHLVNVNTKEHIEFKARRSGFGGMIGANRKPGESFTDYIEEVSSNKVTLAQRTSDWMERTILNLTTKTVEDGGTVRFDTDGAQTNR